MKIKDFLDIKIGGIAKNYDQNTVFRNGLKIVDSIDVTGKLTVNGKANVIGNMYGFEFIEEPYVFDWTRTHLRNRVTSVNNDTLVFINRSGAAESDGKYLNTGKNINDKLSVGGKYDVFQIKQTLDKTVLLFRNGTVNIIGTEQSLFDDVYGWREIVNLECDENKVIGLTLEGKVKIAGNADVNDQKALLWENILDIKIVGNEIIGLKKDGTLISTLDRDLGIFNQIVYFEANQSMIVGVNVFGNVQYLGNVPDTIILDDWTHIEFVKITDTYILGMKNTGYVVSAGPIPEWMDLTKLFNTEYIDITPNGAYAINYDKTAIILGNETAFESIPTHPTNVVNLKDLPDLLPVYIEHAVIQESLNQFREYFVLKDKVTPESWDFFEINFKEIELLQGEQILESDYSFHYSNLFLAVERFELVAIKNVLNVLPNDSMEDLYSATTWTPYYASKINARTVMFNLESTDEAVANAISDLTSKASQLINIVYATEVLITCPSIDDDYKYYPALFNSLKNHESTLWGFVNGALCTQVEVDNLTSILSAEIAELIDVSVARVEIDKNKTIVSSDYNVFGFNKFITVANELSLLLTSEDGTQSQIDTLVQSMKDFRDDLIDINLYKAKIEESFIAFPDSDSYIYTPVSFGRITTARVLLQSLLVDETSYLQLTEVVTDLEVSQTLTVKKLNADFWLTRVPEKTDNAYFEEISFTRFLNAYNALEDQYVNPLATQTTMDLAVAELQASSTSLIARVLTKTIDDIGGIIDTNNPSRTNASIVIPIPLLEDEEIVSFSEIWASHDSESATINIDSKEFFVNAVGKVPLGEALPYKPMYSKSPNIILSVFDKVNRLDYITYEYVGYAKITKVTFNYIRRKR